MSRPHLGARTARPTSTSQPTPTLTPTLTIILTLTSTLSGCLGRGIFRCAEDGQCGADGVCEATGACSLPDPACASARRYRDHAPAELANRCVEEACAANPVVLLRAGGDHACLLRQDGSVACWGQGSSGELGDPAGLASSSMAAVAGLPALASATAVDVALGDRHTCALLTDHSVWCWGANEAGQLGDGTTTSHAQPTPVVGLDDATAVVAGGAFSCALRAGGVVACWGTNTTGELGRGAAGGADATAPAVIDASILHDVRLLAASDRHACAVTRAGSAYCWGSNGQGELGDGTEIDRPGPTPVIDLGTAAITAVGAGVGHTCLVAAGQVSCWGTNLLGELGDGSDVLARPTPALVPVLGAVSDLAAAGHHTCARLVDGTVSCWGANQSGQLGDGTTTNIGVPVPVTGLPDVTSIAVGSAFSCAGRRDGSVWCWGDDRGGQLGTGARLARDLPTPVVGVAGAVAVSAGSGHTCARLSPAPAPAGSAATTAQPTTGVATPATPSTIVCWGANQAGQLGDGTRVDRGTAAPLKVTLDARELSAGALHTCARPDDGGVWCWGRGSSGQLGAAMAVDYALPVRAIGVTAATHIGTGGAHTCAMAAEGAVCWGDNQMGQLGDGTSDPRSSPTVVAGLGGAAGVVTRWALGAEHTCALLTGGRVMCWGRGTEGQLGDGRMTSSASAVLVTGLEDALDIAAGDDHTCAVTASGTVMCWGQGTSGQLGWGSPLGRAAPVEVVGVADAVEVTAGSQHTCVRVAGQHASGNADPGLPGSVFCWGDNRLGQLGDGTRVGQLRAPELPVEPDSLAVAAGALHTCSVRSDHTIVCWGDDATGQLGVGRQLLLATPHPARVPCP
jgi:alpha-tubulin suppressor-like RCC1 family protein